MGRAGSGGGFLGGSHYGGGGYGPHKHYGGYSGFWGFNAEIFSRKFGKC